MSLFSQVISVGIAMSYGMDGQSSSPVRGKKFFFTPQHPDRLWGPLRLPPSGYRLLFPWVPSGRGVKLATHLHLGPE
jgi:hypothetical protein